MGGAVYVQGNVHESGRDGSAEWNAFWDPPAVSHVLSHGPTLHMCPLDCSQHVPLSSSFLSRLACSTAAGTLGDVAAQVLAPMLKSWTPSTRANAASRRVDGGEVAQAYTGEDAYAWDALAASYVLWPHLFTTERAQVRVGLNPGCANEGRTSVITGCALGAPDGAMKAAEQGSVVLLRVEQREWEQQVISLFGPAAAQ